jgi:pantoate--beta-alanine ligase
LEVFKDISSMRDYVARQRAVAKRVVLVPTMGALHEGHGACIRTGRAVENAALVVSIFVNPTQFAPGEDLDQYPRPLESDLVLCRNWDTDAVFAPDADAMYPSARPQRTWVRVEGLTETLCGTSRAGHFEGVTTVVAKLFNIVQPDVAVFGQKDAQQALVIREMVTQLAIPVELRLAQIARESDGLARSSRNDYLKGEARLRAASIYRALRLALEAVRAGEWDPASLTAAVERQMRDGGIEDIEYVEVLDASDLSPLDSVEGKVILAVAVRIGKTRLIDNIVFRVGGGGSVVEELLF